MDLRRVFATGVIIVVLGLQSAVLFPPSGPAWPRFWPFVDYPMYSLAYQPGDRYTWHELRLIPCDTSRRPTTITWTDLRRRGVAHRFLRDLRALAEASRREHEPGRLGKRRFNPDSAAISVLRLAQAIEPTPACRAELRERTLVLPDSALGERPATDTTVETWAVRWTQPTPSSPPLLEVER